MLVLVLSALAAAVDRLWCDRVRADLTWVVLGAVQVAGGLWALRLSTGSTSIRARIWGRFPVAGTTWCSRSWRRIALRRVPLRARIWLLAISERHPRRILRRQEGVLPGRGRLPARLRSDAMVRDESARPPRRRPERVDGGGPRGAVAAPLVVRVHRHARLGLLCVRAVQARELRRRKRPWGAGDPRRLPLLPALLPELLWRDGGLQRVLGAQPRKRSRAGLPDCRADGGEGGRAPLDRRGDPDDRQPVPGQRRLRVDVDEHPGACSSAPRPGRWACGT